MASKKGWSGAASAKVVVVARWVMDAVAEAPAKAPEPVTVRLTERGPFVGLTAAVMSNDPLPMCNDAGGGISQGWEVENVQAQLSPVVTEIFTDWLDASMNVGAETA